MFHSPGFLWLLLLVPLLAWRLFRRQAANSVPFSDVSAASGLPKTLRQRLMWLPSVLTLLSVLCLIIAIARPREGRQQTISQNDGIAIELVVDRSGSMRAMDFKIDSVPVDRLTAIKNVAGEFIAGGDDLPGRLNDLVGLITFAGYADAHSPPTLDHAFLVAQLNETEIVQRRDEDGTAIGDALALAIEKLNALDRRQDRRVKSKIVILLTDGENTAGSLDPKQAAELAEAMKIKVYTIGVGTQGYAPMPMRDPFSGRIRERPVQVTIDEAILQEVSDITGGKYFRATDADSLANIYGEIDRLEKTEIVSEDFVDYRELSVDEYRSRWGTVPPVLMLAFGLVFARVFLEQTWLRELIS